MAYVIRSKRPRSTRLEDDYYPDVPLSMEVIIENGEPEDTGLVDQNGVKIWRTAERERVGF